MFHQRAARWMARSGIGQFVDVGCGLPTGENTHQAVRTEAPDARVVYADNDPVVISHARALLASGSDGVIVIQSDARQPEALFRDPATRRLLRCDEPVGLLLTGVLHFVATTDDPVVVLLRYLDQLPPGSLVAVSYATNQNMGPLEAAEGLNIYQETAHPIVPRNRDEVRTLLEPIKLVPPYRGAEPDVVAPRDWLGPDMPHPDGAERGAATTGLWCGAGGKA